MPHYRYRKPRKDGKPRKGRKPQKMRYAITPFRGKQMGYGFLGNLWKKIKKGASFIKKHKLVSKGLSSSKDPRVKFAGQVAKSLGFGLTPSGGRYRRGGKRRVGRPRRNGRHTTATRKPRKKRVGRPRKKGSGLRLAGAGRRTRMKKYVFP